MNKDLYRILMEHFRSEAVIAEKFGLSRVAYFKNGVPMHIAQLCHMCPDIPYTFDPSHYGKTYEGLSLNLTKPTKI